MASSPGGPVNRVGAAACVALGAGFGALAAWSVATGLAGAKYGAASRADSPALFWFLVAGQLFIGAGFVFTGLKVWLPGLHSRRPAVAGLAVLLALGVGMGLERAAAFASIVLAAESLGEALTYAALGLIMLGVIGAVLYQLLWLELKERLERRDGSR